MEEVRHAAGIKTGLVSWLVLFRLGATARGVLPFLLGAVIAWSQGNPINWAVLGLSLVAVIAIMEMTFLVNDYYDYEADVANKEFHRLSGGSRVLPLGLVSPRRSLAAGYICLGIAAVIGLFLYFYYQTGPYTIPLGALAIFMGYFYTARPVKLCYRGWGEVAIWFSCGWLATILGYYLQTGHFDTVATLVSFPGATSVFLVILMNEIPDIKSDRLVGKKNLAVRLGREKAAVLYIILLIACYFNIVAIIFFGAPALSGLLSIVLVPLIIWNILTIRRQGLKDTRVQEGLSLRTMLVDHLITIIYSVAFLVAGASLMTGAAGEMVALIIIYLIIFGLEGLGVFCSSQLTRE